MKRDLTPQEKQGLKLISNLQLTIEYIEELRGTKLDDEKFRYLAQRMIDLLEKKQKWIYSTGLQSDHEQVEFFKYSNLIDTFNKLLVTVEIDRLMDFHEIMKNFMANKLEIIDNIQKAD